MKRILSIIVFILLFFIFSCKNIGNIQGDNLGIKENPVEMFDDLCEKYLKTEYKFVNASQSTRFYRTYISFFNINKELSKDVFCQVVYDYRSLGKTKHFVYKRDSENILYIHEKKYLYTEPPFISMESAEIVNTYYKYINDLLYVFNEETDKYDIRLDTNNEDDMQKNAINYFHIFDTIGIVQYNESGR